MSVLRIRRPGLTLIEVLVSIFVMGIGLISLLVLFPLGSLYWANANKDDLTGHSAADASALAMSFNLRQDPAITPFYTTPPNGLPAPGTTGPGYPVYVDPIGVFDGGFANTTVAGQGIPRVAPSFVQNPQSPAPSAQWAADQYFSLLDNMSFDGNGRPVVAPPVVGQVERPPQSSYTWAYLLRPALPDGKGNYSVYLTVVVYKQRSTVVLGENAFNNITFVPGNLSVQVPYTGTLPNIKKGSWILDATLNDVAATDPQMQPAPHGFFYRVANVTDLGGVLDVELESPLRNPNPAFTAWICQTGVLVTLDDVVEVFERGP